MEVKPTAADVAAVSIPWMNALLSYSCCSLSADVSSCWSRDGDDGDEEDDEE
jgi:hypothetical protein